MSEDTFDTSAWLRRIGYDGPTDPSLATLRGIVLAHASTIPYENFDVLLGRPPKLSLGALQRKLVSGCRGGYCFEQNMVLREGLRGLGFIVTSLLGRVVLGFAADADRPAGHMVLRVELPAGPFLADVGFGHLTPTAPLALQTHLEQPTPHETLRLLPIGDELLLQARLRDGWQNLYRLSPRPALNFDYEVANWFTATHPNSPFIGNMIAARPGPDGTRITFLNGRVSVRQPPDRLERRMLPDQAAYRHVLAETFGLVLPAEDLREALNVLRRKGALGSVHPFFT